MAIKLLPLRFGQALVSAAALEPKQKGDEKRWQSHDGECEPIQNMGRELAFELLDRDNETFSWLTGVSELCVLGFLVCAISDLAGSEVVAAPDTELWSENHSVRRV